MVQRIFFTGLKGGSGKTTLAVHFSNFAFFHLKKSVVLINFDFQNQLSFFGKDSPYPILNGDINNQIKIELLFKEIENFDFAIFDIPSGFNPKFIDFHKYSDLIVIPFEYMQIDFFKVFGLIEILTRKLILTSKNVLLIPNKQDRHQDLDLKFQFEHQIKNFELYYIAPYINLSNHLRSITFSPLLRTNFYLLRPTFRQIEEIIQKIKF